VQLFSSLKRVGVDQAEAWCANWLGVPKKNPAQSEVGEGLSRVKTP
jgi:hypothetical protein